MSVNIRHLPIVTIMDEDCDKVEFRMDENGDITVEMGDNIVLTTIDELEQVVKALKGEESQEATPVPTPKREFRVGDKVRVNEHSQFVGFYSEGAEGEIIAFDEGTYPIIIRISKSSLNGPYMSAVGHEVGYRPEALELVEEARKPGEFRVGDKVRVVRSDIWVDSYGPDAEGIVESTDGSHPESYPYYPIVIRLTRYGRYHAGCRENAVAWAYYTSAQLELIEEARS